MTNRPLQKFVLVLSLSMLVITLCGCIMVKDGRALWKKATPDKRLAGFWIIHGTTDEPIEFMPDDHSNALVARYYVHALRSGKLVPAPRTWLVRSLTLGKHHFLISEPGKALQAKRNHLPHASVLTRYSLKDNHIHFEVLKPSVINAARKAGNLRSKSALRKVSEVDVAIPGTDLKWLKKIAGDKNAWKPFISFEKAKNREHALHGPTTQPAK